MLLAACERPDVDAEERRIAASQHACNGSTIFRSRGGWRPALTMPASRGSNRTKAPFASADEDTQGGSTPLQRLPLSSAIDSMSPSMQVTVRIGRGADDAGLLLRTKVFELQGQ